MVWPTSLDTKLDDFFAMELPGLQLASSQASSHLDQRINLDIKANPPCVRLTGIMASVGPSLSMEDMVNLMSNGLNVAVINLAYNTREEHTELIKTIREATKTYSEIMGMFYPLAIAFQLVGRKFRTGTIAESHGTQVELRTGELVRLTTDETYQDKGTNFTIYVDFVNIGEHLKKNDIIIVDNDTIKLRVEVISTSTLTCRVERGGFLGSQKDLYVVGQKFNIPSLYENDKSDLMFAIHQGIDIIIIPYVNDGRDITEVREFLGDKGKNIGLVAKIQTRFALDTLDDIFAVCHGILVARQELAADINFNKLAIAQKHIVARANKANIPCAISSQLLASMMQRKVPYRSEILDISNCILDGVDSLMLTNEVATGSHPVESVTQLAMIAKEAEAAIWTKQVFWDLVDETPIPCDSLYTTAIGAVMSAMKVLAAAIIVITTSGKSAQAVSKYKPRCPIIGVTRYAINARKMQLNKAVIPLVYEGDPHVDWQLDVEKRANFAITFGMNRGFIRIGDPLILVCGWRQGSGNTNTVRTLYAREDVTPIH